MADLFEPAQLERFLQLPVGTIDEEAALIARRIASGWLRSATALDTWPDPTPDDLFGWALELAALLYENPTKLVSDTTGSVGSTWEKGQRDAILAAAAKSYATGGPAMLGKPQGSFPQPDPLWARLDPRTSGYLR